MKRLLSVAAAALSSLLPLGVAGVFLSLTACGSDNVFEPLVRKNDKDKGRQALEDGDFDAAIRNLQDYLAAHPGDPQASTMLATAYMSKAGFNVIKFGAKISESGKGDWKGILGAMPAGTAENARSLASAVAALEAIPASARSEDQSYQLALAQASLAVILTKKAAGDGDNVTDEKIAAMPDADAEAIYDTLKDAKDTIAASGALKQNSSAGKLSGLAEKIASEPGATDAEKMKAYLKKNN